MFIIPLCHITNKLISNRSLTIISIVSVLIGFIFVNLLLFYFPRDNSININFKSNQPIIEATKNQIVTTDLNVFNITKALAKNGISVTYDGPVNALNQDYQNTSNSFNNILNSKGFISNGQDTWFERLKSQTDQMEILDLSKFIEVKSKKPGIDISFGNQSSQINSASNSGKLDYSYLMDEGNLKITIEKTANFLIKLDPDSKDKYYKNQVELNTQVSNIENRFTNITLCQKSPIITNSNNLSYLATKYGFELTMFSNFDPTKPQPNQIKYLKDFAKSKNITSFFIDKKIPIIDYTNLRNSLGLDIYFISDYTYPDVIDTLTKNLENLQKSQGC